MSETHIVPHSSNVAKLEYEASRHELIVHFKNGGMYRYDRVPPESFAALKNAQSVGSHLHQHIKGKHPATKIG